MHGLPRARGFTHTRAQMCGVWPPAPLYPGLIPSEWQVCTPICCGGRCSLGADKGGRDALGCWTNLRSCLCFFLNPLHILAFPACPSVISLLCLFCAFCCLLNLLCLRPYLFLLLGLALSTFPNSPCPFCSPVSSPSACPRTRVQLRLRGGQLLPSHWRSSHRPSTEAFGDLDVRVAYTRALLHSQPPPGEGREPSWTLCACLLQSRSKMQGQGTLYPASYPDRKCTASQGLPGLGW